MAETTSCAAEPGQTVSDEPLFTRIRLPTGQALEPVTAHDARPAPSSGGELDHPGQRMAIRMQPHTPYSRLNAANDADADSNWHGKLNHGLQM